MMPWTNLKAVSILVAIFVSGVVTGTMYTSRTHTAATKKAPCEKSMAQRMVSRLAKQLDLGEDQVVQIRPVVEFTCNELTEIHQETLERCCMAMQKNYEQLTPFLDDKQLVTLEKLKADQQMIREKNCGAPGVKCAPAED